MIQISIFDIQEIEREKKTEIKEEKKTVYELIKVDDEPNNEKYKAEFTLIKSDDEKIFKLSFFLVDHFYANSYEINQLCLFLKKYKDIPNYHLIFNFAKTIGINLDTKKGQKMFEQAFLLMDYFAEQFCVYIYDG